MATNSSPQIWKIEHPCPQCGAPVVLEETDRIFRCQYCRNRLFIAPREHFKYFLAPKEPAPDLIFLPYWRFRGMMFSFEALNVESRIIDTSMLALDPCRAPMSLGMRPQVLKLRFVSPGITGIFLKPRFPFKRSLLREPDLPELGNPQITRPKKTLPEIEPAFIGETESLIYSPVSLRGDALFDEILKAPLGIANDSLPALPAELERCEPEDQLTLLPTMCPRCGWDMEGEKNSLVVFCRNCSAGWQCGRTGFESVKFAFPAAGSEENTAGAVYFPFWRLDATVTGLQLGSYADLVRLANLPSAIRDEWRSRQLHFWVPAFKLQPNLFLRLSRAMTTFQPDPEENPRLPKSGILPVTLPQTEALETLQVLIASMAVPKKNVFPLLPGLSYRLNDRMLAYLRFIQRGQELIQEDFKMSIQASAVLWGQLI